MPFAQRVTTDEWVGVRNNLVTIECDGIERALDAIHRLDGEVRTEVSLEGPNKVLSIAGGNYGRYVCFIAFNGDEMFLNLLNPTGSQESEVEVVAGGQAGTFPTRRVVDLEAVLKAANYFFQSGEPDPSLVWERQ